MNIKSIRGLQRNVRGGYTAGLAGVALVVAVLFSFLAPGSFFSELNVQSIAYAVPEIGLMALAISVAMTTGGIDLSVVSIANLSGLTAIFVSTKLVDEGFSAWTATVIALGASVVVGLVGGTVNGLLVARVGIRPILATLATQQLFAGLAIALTRGKPLFGGTAGMTVMGVGTLAGIPFLFWGFLVILLGIALLMGKTAFGVRAVMLGENPVATEYSGISRVRSTLYTYVLAGTLSAVAGVLMTLRTGSASAGYGGSYLMVAITIAVLGGANPFGGKVAIWGGALAAIILQMISSGLNALGYDAYIYQIVQGVILVAVFVFQWESHRVGSPRRRPRLRLAAEVHA